jgi:hypothetical protein
METTQQAEEVELSTGWLLQDISYTPTSQTTTQIMVLVFILEETLKTVQYLM